MLANKESTPETMLRALATTLGALKVTARLDVDRSDVDRLDVDRSEADRSFLDRPARMTALLDGREKVLRV